MNKGLWDGDRFTEFKCPLCGTDGYVRIRVQRPNGHWYVTNFYQCFGCSVMFTDPVAFTRQRQLIRDPRPLTHHYYGSTYPPPATSETEKAKS